MKKMTFWAGIGAACLMSFSASAGQTIKIQSAATAGSWADGFYQEWVGKYNAMTGEDGTKIEILTFQSVVPYKEVMQATANGIIGGDMNAVSYYAGMDPVFGLIGDLIAGYDTVEQLITFCQYGGGKEVLQKAYDKYTSGRSVVIGCGAWSREAFASTKPINTVADLSGVKVRAPEGLAAEVFKRAGAAPVALPLSEVYSALEKGVIDAADASSYLANSDAGFHDIAKYPIYPGIHSMAVLQLVVNKSMYDKMSEQDRIALDVWYKAMITSMARASDLEDKKQVIKDISAGKVTIVDWPQAERDKLRELAVGAWEDTAAKSELAQEALAAHKAFMKANGMLK